MLIEVFFHFCLQLLDILCVPERSVAFEKDADLGNMVPEYSE